MRLLAVFLALAAVLSAREAEVTILATSDLHGNIYPYDYLSGTPAERGFAKIATLIQRERATAPDALLVDAGDTIQGAPIEGLWQSYVETGKLPAGLHFPSPAPAMDPMMLAMNHLRYDAMALGNHEFNYGLKNLNRARSEARFPWLSANTEASDGTKPFLPYLVKVVNGVRVGLVGITTPTIPSWEKPENYKGYAFTDAVAAARKAVEALRKREKADVVVVVAHSGLDRDLKTGAVREMDLPGENAAFRIAAEVPGVDAIVFGHTHSALPEHRVNGVLLTQPKNWGMSLARVDLRLETGADGKWRVKSKSSRLIPVTAEISADPEVLRLARPYHELTERWLETPVTRSGRALSASTARIEDTAIIDAIHEVQLHYAKADVSFASSFNPRAAIPAGPVTVRQIAALYLYDNELYAIEGNGKMVREALENSARYYESCTPPACGENRLIGRSVLGFNYDMAQGVTYDIDLTRPPGQRIRNLRYKGEPLSDDRKLRIAVNNYRAGGSGGYTMFKDAPVVWRSFETIRDLMIRYYAEHPLPSEPDGNWKVQPESARRRLMQDVQADAGAGLTQ